MENKLSQRVALALIAFGAVSRLLPHPPNVTPLTAMALLGGAALAPSQALLIPLGALVVSDLFLGFHAVAPFVYACFLATAALGLRLKRSQAPGRVAAACLASSVLFFVVTNFGVWLLTGLYARNGAGLAACYAAAIPFFRNALLGDAAYTLALFGLQAAALRTLKRQPATA